MPAPPKPASPISPPLHTNKPVLRLKHSRGQPAISSMARSARRQLRRSSAGSSGCGPSAMQLAPVNLRASEELTEAQERIAGLAKEKG